MSGAVERWTEFGLTNASLIRALSVKIQPWNFFYPFFGFNSMGKSVPPCDDRKSFSLPEQHRDLAEDPDRSSFLFIYIYIFLYFLYGLLYSVFWC